ncbi:MAG: Maf family protein [Candidatus Hodarchaeales archaeon]|jgi:septum formation protein
MVAILKPRKLILGSASKPRSWVMDQIGLPFEVRVSNSIEENPLTEDSINESAAEKIVLENSSQKLDNILNNLSEVDKQKFFGVLCFDTVIWLPPDNYISKPSSKDNLLEILLLLSGKTHKVLTAFSYVPISKEGILLDPIQDVDVCLVSFNKINEFFIDKYVAKPFAVQFAGGYNIQGSSAMFIESIKGDYYTVVGVPLNLWLTKLERLNSKNYEELVSNISFR